MSADGGGEGGRPPLLGLRSGGPAAVLSFEGLPTVLVNLSAKEKRQPGPRPAHSPASHNRAFG